MSDTLIKVEGVSKKYSKDLKHMMSYGIQDVSRNILGLEALTGIARPGEFWALDDISFSMKRGESLGVIGPNGSGKTTLLKLLNGIFMPDKGRIRMTGEVGALIQVGAGFHPMLTGRENIYINGTILGMTKREIDEKFDSIVDFSGIGDFVNSPVKHYSSGMYVRLGFSVAIHCEPDILLVDEILAVGDRDFVLKSHKKMREVREKGVCIVLVSHNENAIREQTDRCLYLDRGKPVFLGSSEDGVSLYIKDSLMKGRTKEKGADGRVHAPPTDFDKKAEIKGFRFIGRDKEEVSFVKSGDALDLEIEVYAKEKITDPVFSVNFYGENKFLYCANSYYEKVSFDDIDAGKIRVTIHIPDFRLPIGNYLCSVLVAEGGMNNLLDWHNMAYKISVGRADNARGSIKLPAEWKLEAI